MSEAIRTSAQETLDITLTEEFLFNHLDKLGVVAEILLDSFPFPNIKINPDGSVGLRSDTPKVIESIDKDTQIFNDLTKKQLLLLNTLLSQIQERRKEINTLYKSINESDIVQMAWDTLPAAADRKKIPSTNITVLKTPLGVVIITHDADTSRAWQLNEDWVGMFMTGAKDAHLSGLVTYVRLNGQTLAQVQATIVHELIHLLNHNFIQKNNIDDPVTKKYNNLSTKKSQLSLEKTVDTAYSKILNLLSPEVVIEEESIDSIEQEMEPLIESTHNLLTPEALSIFKQIQDELLAYGYGSGRLQTNADTLVRTQTFEQALDLIIHPTERSKIKNGWRICHNLLNICIKHKTPPKDLTKIFTTSQNFDIMNKRIAQYLRRQYHITLSIR